MMQDNIWHYSQLYTQERNTSKSYEVRNKVNILKRLPVLNNLSNRKILEIGFGTGDLLLTISSNKNNRYNTFVGLELVESTIHNLKKSRPDFHLYQGSAEALPFSDNSFDIIICSHVLEHLKNDEVCVGEITRVLKHGGYAVVAVPVYGDSSLHYRQYSVKSFRSLLIKNMTLVYLKSHGSILVKLIQKLINIFFKYYQNRSISYNTIQMPITMKIHYNYFVPFWLILDRIDDIFARIDSKPIQLVGVFKKDNAKK